MAVDENTLSQLCLSAAKLKQPSNPSPSEPGQTLGEADSCLGGWVVMGSSVQTAEITSGFGAMKHTQQWWRMGATSSSVIDPTSTGMVLVDSPVPDDNTWTRIYTQARKFKHHVARRQVKKS